MVSFELKNYPLIIVKGLVKHVVTNQTITLSTTLKSRAENFYQYIVITVLALEKAIRFFSEAMQYKYIEGQEIV